MKEDGKIEKFCTLIRFRGRRVKIFYENSYDDYYGYFWRFISRELADVEITIGDQESIHRQIRRHAKARTSTTAHVKKTTIHNRRSKTND